MIGFLHPWALLGLLAAGIPVLLHLLARREPPTVVSTAAIVAAVRDATGRELARVPVRPDDVVGL